MELETLTVAQLVKKFLAFYGTEGSLPCPPLVPEKEKLNSVASVGKRNIPTEQPPLVGEVVPTFAYRGCRVVSATDSHGRYLGFLDWSRYFFLQVASQLSSRGWVDPVPDPLLLRKSGSADNRTRGLWICSQKPWPLDHRRGPNTGPYYVYFRLILITSSHLGLGLPRDLFPSGQEGYIHFFASIFHLEIPRNILPQKMLKCADTLKPRHRRQLLFFVLDA
jgi:hypothetical protein